MEKGWYGLEIGDLNKGKMKTEEAKKPFLSVCEWFKKSRTVDGCSF
ncbi:hypothetical protein JFV29_17330 [Peribacillus sp. TH16]|nr:hypothetical protein [Peribacillus sp. TH16]MBK5483612.1 hypothetical protein [Peribacillus sp. TH16]